ncbi:hypothetical protein [Kitasatospora sp. NPDC057198]|uniref:hypothetical protein n=1 Tax=Kitasatospora sp. NPDC057198 TaxID=3346046 RepID=UPI0036447A10
MAEPPATYPALYARPRLLGRAAAAALALTGVQLWFGSVAVVLPGGFGGDSTLQLRMLLAVAWAALAAGSLHSGMHGWEAAAGPRLRQAERTHLLTAGAAALALACGAELLISGPASAAALGRALLIWWGLAVLSGRLWGRPQVWILPAATLFPLGYLGWDASGTVRWWNWPWQDWHSTPSWLLAAASLTLGAAAWHLTPWRLRELRGRLLRSTRPGNP